MQVKYGIYMNNTIVISYRKTLKNIFARPKEVDCPLQVIQKLVERRKIKKNHKRSIFWPRLLETI